MNDYKLAVQQCCTFLQHYQFLTEMYIVEFFTNDHWQKLPLLWKNFLISLEPPDIGKLLLMPTAKHKQDSVCPLSLLAFKKCTQIFSISRTPKTLFGSCANTFYKNNKKHAFSKHVKPKKQHEIHVLSQLVASIFTKENCTSVVDVGSGQGHLSRLLSLGFNFPVTSLECENSYLKKAELFDYEAKLHLRKTVDRSETLQMESAMNITKSILPNYLQFKILPNTSSSEFRQALNINRFSNETNKANVYDRCLLTGLHACGDLSATMIRLFKESSNIHALVSVGCCYMKLTACNKKCNPDLTRYSDMNCYPMSNYVKSIADHHLSYKSRELACHAIEDFQIRLRENSLHLKMHCYRAVLEYLIRQSFPDLIRPGVQTIKKAYLLSFAEYVEKAYKKLNLGDVPIRQLQSDEVERMLNDWKNVLIFFTLALMIAPVIESVILLDRVIFLLENNIQSELVSVFDPLVSPRCFAIVAKKTCR